MADTLPNSIRDYLHQSEFAIAHLVLAREAIAAALADLVESGWFEEEEATSIAPDWLHTNPNPFYDLGPPPLA
jgi:hypothetical protein